jgi:subtilisin family serine protease
MSATAARAHGTGTVTLVTGDRVTLRADGKVSVRRGADRDGMAFVVRRVAGNVHVVPADAVPLITSGRLDERLFDVTTLIDFGYDDRRGDLPLIVTADSANRAARSAARSAVTGEGVTVVRDLPAVNGLAVRAGKAGIPALWRGLTDGAADARTLRSGVSAVWLDGLRAPSLDVSVPQIGAPAAWAAGLDGAGVKVAVLDTGVDPDHPDLAGQVVARQNFTEGEEDDLDRVGHGTHVASTIAGTGAASDGRYTGVAPKASLLDGKVCVEFGCAESWILAGMQWAAEQGANVVNLSLGGSDTPEDDPLEQGIDALTEEFGTLFVVAAGNSGDDATISSPASADSALAVGAVTKSDELAGFSSRGPRVDGGLKPEITAPGEDIVAANSSDGFLGEPGESYTTLSGTSMSTPHVVGAAAILAQRHPDASPADLRALLMGSAKPLPGLGVFAQGAGRVDVARAITQAVTANPPAVGFGRQQWPHGDDTAVERTVTYRNRGDAAVTLALSLDTVGPNGEPAPTGFFTLSASSVTVPAAGQATVTVTADTRLGTVDGYYTGRITGSGGGASITTPFAIDREVESYDVTLRHLDRTGAPAGDYFSVLARTDRFGVIEVYDPDGTAVVRAPKGTYALLSVVIAGDGESVESLTTLAQPALVVTRDVAATVDARRGKPISVTVPRRDADPLLVDVTTEVIGDDFGVGFSVGGEDFDGLYAGRLGPDRAAPWFATTVSTTFARRTGEDDITNSPFAYVLSWREPGKMINGFTERVRPGDLATVRASHARQGPPGAYRVTFPIHEGGGSASAVGLRLRLPFTQTQFVNTDDGVRWLTFMDEVTGTGEDERWVSTLYGVEERYRAGRTYVERWNRAALGPSLLDPVSPYEYLSRYGDTMVVVVPTHSDAESRAGFANVESGGVTVYRDGVEVGAADSPYAEVEVPAAAGRYRVEQEAVRAASMGLSTRVSSAWTFRSGHVPGEEPRRMPISVIRFTPDVDDRNAAPAGRAVAVPVTVQRQPGSGAGPARSLRVQASYDDGRTWRTVRLTRDGDRWLAHLRHPDRAGFVSLRAASTDAAGNTTEQTIIRAYRTVR